MLRSVELAQLGFELNNFYSCIVADRCKPQAGVDAIITLNVIITNNI